MILKEIGREIAQAFRLAKTADEKVIQSLAAYGFSTDEAACAIANLMSQKPEPLRNLTNNWRKMHGLPMHRKPTAFRKRRKSK